MKPTAIVAAALYIMTLNAQGSHARAQQVENSKPAEQSITPAQKYFTDVMLVNQDGQQMRLYSDLIKGKVVVIIPFFTSCTGVCPVMNRNLAKIQDAIGDRLGKDIYLISISVDPITDTPSRLKDYAVRFNARPGWYFLTGKKENVDLALYKLGQKVEAREDHSNIMIIGNDRTGLWKKAFSLANTEELVKVVGSVADDKPSNSK